MEHRLVNGYYPDVVNNPADSREILTELANSYLGNNRLFANRFFWRTRSQQEIDYIEESYGILHAYEFKWNPIAKAFLPKSFRQAYPEHRFEIINRNNYQGFIS
ncbi:MAG: hypothetical protein WC865_06175 [Bacteroidales bacterium]